MEVARWNGKLTRVAYLCLTVLIYDKISGNIFMSVLVILWAWTRTIISSNSYNNSKLSRLNSLPLLGLKIYITLDLS